MLFWHSYNILMSFWHHFQSRWFGHMSYLVKSTWLMPKLQIVKKVRYLFVNWQRDDDRPLIGALADCMGTVEKVPMIFFGIAFEENWHDWRWCARGESLIHHCDLAGGHHPNDGFFFADGFALGLEPSRIIPRIKIHTQNLLYPKVTFPLEFDGWLKTASIKPNSIDLIEAF